MGGELFALGVMVVGTVVLIRAGAFILDNLDDALGESLRDLSADQVALMGDPKQASIINHDGGF